MRKMCIGRLLLLLICLSVLALTANARTGNQWRRRQPSGLYQVVTRDEKSGERRVGFIDKTGRLVIGFDRLPQNTFAVGEFSEGRAVIYLKEGEVAGTPRLTAGYIDADGRVVIAPRFYTARDFSEGLAYVEGKGFRGFINAQGKTVIRLDDDLMANDFHGGLAVVRELLWSGRDDWGYIDRTGKLVIKRQYQFATDFSEGLAGVAVAGKYGFIDRRGEVTIPPRFDLLEDPRHRGPIDSGHFSEGLACVRVGGLYGYINKAGDFVIPPQFAGAQDFSEGLAWVVTRDEKTYVQNKVGWIDKAGRWSVTRVGGRALLPELSEFFNYTNEWVDWRYSEGLVSFVVNDKNRTLRGYMDKKGNVAIQPGEFDVAFPFVGGVARVALHGRWAWDSDEARGYLDKTGRLIWPRKK
jgi:hypothetical protein